MQMNLIKLQMVFFFIKPAGLETDFTWQTLQAACKKSSLNAFHLCLQVTRLSKSIIFMHWVLSK